MIQANATELPESVAAGATATVEVPARSVSAPAPLPALLPADRRRAPLPVGLLTGRRTRWRRFSARVAAAVNRAFDRLPAGRWLHARAQRSLEVHHVEIELRRGEVGLDGLTIAFLSDLHAGSCMDADDLARIFERVMRLSPDLVCLGGDLINTREREIEFFAQPLQILRPPLGVFAVPGNHDHFFGAGIDRWRERLASFGVRVLCNEGVCLARDGASLFLSGVDDLTEATPDLATALAGWNGSDPVVLLSHHPDFFFEAAAVGVDLTLSGHTHGGQVKVFGKAICHSQFGWLQGRQQAAGQLLYVSRGVGTTVLPIRYNAPPEVPVLRLWTPGRGPSRHLQPKHTHNEAGGYTRTVRTHDMSSIPAPAATAKHGQDGAPNGCNDCHAGKDAAWTATHMAQWWPQAK